MATIGTAIDKLFYIHGNHSLKADGTQNQAMEEEGKQREVIIIKIINEKRISKA